MTLPLVSIITPSFNQAAYLEQTLLSILEQDYPQIEYWVMDGGSTDGSTAIIEKYAPRLAGWVSEKDRGQADAINKGFGRSTGEIIGWLNSDDLYLPGAIQTAVQALQADPGLAMVYADVRSIDSVGKVFNVMRYGDWGLADLMAFNIIGQPGVFMRRSMLEKAGYLDLNFHFLLDHQLWLRLAQQGGMKHIPEEMAAARFHADAKNVAQAARFGQEAYTILDWMQTQPGLQSLYTANRRRIQAGAHRINARYLLDGGQAAPALRAYWRSLLQHPPTALREGHRMVYAALALLGLGRLKNIYYRLRRGKVDV
jgi:glycosyltransferase involved in cell wall biosynthesis